MNASTEQQVKWAAETISMAAEVVNPGQSRLGEDAADYIKWGLDNLNLTEMADFLIAIGTMIKQDEASYQAALNN